MKEYRCLCGQALAGFVIPPPPLPVAGDYVRRAVAEALVRHLERVDVEADAATDVAHGVTEDTHSNGEPWVLGPPLSGSRREVGYGVRTT